MKWTVEEDGYASTPEGYTQTFLLHANDLGRALVLANAQKFLAALPESKPWEVKIAPLVKKRTDRQNAALFGVAYPPLSAASGEDVDELHTAFCKRFFGRVEVEIFGEVSVRPFRTTTRDEHGKRDVIPWDRFCEFYAMVQRVAAEAGIFVPDPDPRLRTK